MANYLTFLDMQNEVARAIKDDSKAKEDLIKHVINQVYLNEVVKCDDLYPLHYLCVHTRKSLHKDQSIEDITPADPGVVTITDHGFVGGEIITFFAIAGMVELNYDNTASPDDIGYFKVEKVTDDTFKIKDQNNVDFDTSGFTAYTSGGSVFHQGWNITEGVREILDVGIYDEIPMSPISYSEFIKDNEYYFDNNTSYPDSYLLWQRFSAGTEFNDLFVLPASNEDYIGLIHYCRAVDKLDADADVPDIPHEFQNAIVSGAITRLAESDVQVENQVVWPTIYNSQLNAIRTENRRWWTDQDNMRETKPYGLLGGRGASPRGWGRNRRF